MVRESLITIRRALNEFGQENKNTDIWGTCLLNTSGRTKQTKLKAFFVVLKLKRL